MKKRKVNYVRYRGEDLYKSDSIDTFFGAVPKRYESSLSNMNPRSLGKYSNMLNRRPDINDRYDGKLDYQAVQHIDRSDFAEYRYGFECEKEDDLSSHNPVDYLKWGFAPESDGSLDNGFELVSPMFDLFDTKLEETIDSSEDIRRDLNADFRSTCGGHMSLSHAYKSGVALYSEIEQWMPLLYALYPRRLRNSYSRCVTNYAIKTYGAERNAISVGDNRIEFRLFPAIRSVKNLLWRVDLLRLIIENKHMTNIEIGRSINDRRTKLGKHLSKVYNDARRKEKAELFLGLSYLFLDRLGVKKKYVKNIEDNHPEVYSRLCASKSTAAIKEYASLADVEKELLTI